jgi:hypothetical protein
MRSQSSRIAAGGSRAPTSRADRPREAGSAFALRRRVPLAAFLR